MGNFLERQEAITLLKELLALGIVQPSFVSVEKNKQGTYSLTMKPNGNLTEIRAFLSDKDLILYEDKEKGICSICKP